MNKQINTTYVRCSLRDSYKVVFAKMGDTERRVIAEIKDNGEDYSLAGVNTVEVRCRKADGKQVTKNATKDNNTIVIDISGQMTTCKGTAIVDVVLYGTDGGVLSTAKFYLNVDDGAVNEDDIKSSNEYESLTDALRTVGLAKEVANTALNTANEAVKTAESAMKQIPVILPGQRQRRAKRKKIKQQRQIQRARQQILRQPPESPQQQRQIQQAQRRKAKQQRQIQQARQQKVKQQRQTQ